MQYNIILHNVLHNVVNNSTAVSNCILRPIINNYG